MGYNIGVAKIGNMKTLTLQVENREVYTTHTYYDELDGSGFMLTAYRELNTQRWVYAKVWCNDSIVEEWDYSQGWWIRQSDGLKVKKLNRVLTTHGKLGHFLAT